MAQITLNSSGVASNGSLLLQSNGTTTAVTIDTAQNLGLGVTPSAWTTFSSILQGVGYSLAGFSSGSNVQSALSCNSFYNSSHKYLTTAAASQYLQISGQHQWFNAPSGTAGNTITFTQAMTLDDSGNLMVGTTSTNRRLAVQHAVENFTTETRNTASTNPYGMYIYYSAASPNNASSQFVACVDSSVTRAEIRSNGGLANYSANNVNLSDRREKTNFAPATSYLDKICAIPVQTFNYIDQNMEVDGGLTLGVVAQDVQAVAPEMVMESNWGTQEEPKMRLSIYQTDLQYALMKCIQELNAKFEAYKASHP